MNTSETQKAPIKGLVSTEHYPIGTPVYFKSGVNAVSKGHVCNVVIGAGVAYNVTTSNYSKKQEDLFLTPQEAFDAK